MFTVFKDDQETGSIIKYVYLTLNYVISTSTMMYVVNEYEYEQSKLPRIYLFIGRGVKVLINAFVNAA